MLTGPDARANFARAEKFGVLTKAETKKRRNEVAGEVIKVRRGGKQKTREETDEEEDEEEEKERENVRKKRKKMEEAEREEREWRVQMDRVLTRIDEREQQREVWEGHMVKVADWVAAMICDATRRVREWDMERKKAETGLSGSEEMDKETENREKAEVGGGEDGTEGNTGDGGQMEVDKDGEKDERTEKTGEETEETMKE